MEHDLDQFITSALQPEPQDVASSILLRENSIDFDNLDWNLLLGQGDLSLGGQGCELDEQHDKLERADLFSEVHLAEVPQHPLRQTSNLQENFLPSVALHASWLEPTIATEDSASCTACAHSTSQVVANAESAKHNCSPSLGTPFPWLAAGAPGPSAVGMRNKPHDESEDGRVCSGAKDGRAKLRRQLELARLSQRRFRKRQKVKSEEGKVALTRMAAQLRVLEARTSVLQQENALLKRMAAAAGSGTFMDAGKSIVHRRSKYSTLRLERAMQAVHNVSKVLQLPRLKLTLSPEQLQELAIEEVLRLWRDYVGIMGRQLMDADGDPMSPAGVAVGHTVMELAQLFSSLVLHNPQAARQLQVLKLDGGSSQGQLRGNIMDYQSFEAAAGISDEQRLQLLFARRRLFRDLAPVVEQRRELIAQLEGCSPDGSGWAFVRGSEILEALSSNLRDEHEVTSTFVTASIYEMFTAFQGGAVVVHSYPWFPDSLEYANWLAQHHEEPSAHELLKCVSLGANQA